MPSYRDLFPACSKPGCQEHPGIEQHVLPHQVEVVESVEKYVASIGGYGSGKTLGNVVLGNLLSLAVPGNLGFVGRRTLPKLHESTQRIYLETLQRSGVQVDARDSRDGWPHRIIYPNGSEVVFRPTQDLGRFLGPEYGWFYIDEAQEESENTFKRLAGRLRLPRASKYLKGLFSSNPPHKSHWLAQLFPRPGSWRTQEEVAGEQISTLWRMIRTSTMANPFLDPGYIANLKTLHSPAEIKKILGGFYGFETEGRPVYGNFLFERNVAAITTGKITLVRSWDFGYHNPVVTWHQFPKCKRGKAHWITLHEIVPKDIEAEPLADLVLEETTRKFPGHPKQFVLDCGDFAGAQHKDSGPGPIVRLAKPPWRLQFRYRQTRNIDPGIALIRRALGLVCECGQPLLLIDRTCTEVIDTLAGGYHYPDETKIQGRDKGPIMDKPTKDGYYDNIADSMRYAAENFFRSVSQDPAFLDLLLKDYSPKGISMPTGPSEGDDWRWMEGMRG